MDNRVCRRLAAARRARSLERVTLFVAIASVASCTQTDGKPSKESCTKIAKHAAEVAGEQGVEAEVLEHCQRASNDDEYTVQWCFQRAKTMEDLKACDATWRSSDTVKTQAARRDAEHHIDAIELYMLQKRECPKDFAALKRAGIVVEFEDPWGIGYELECSMESKRIVVSSAGPDGKFGTADDITSL